MTQEYVTRISKEEDWLRTLLAVIHRDGGHHTHAVGLEQSVKDARGEVIKLRHDLLQLQEFNFERLTQKRSNPCNQ